MKTIKTLIISIALMLIAVSANTHEGGHAKGIRHLTGYRTHGIDKVEPCGNQNKVLLYHDIENDGIYDECTTLWEEHKKSHTILSKPVNNECECEGYLWLDNDSQDTTEEEE
jgi:hypothetical protein